MQIDVFIFYVFCRKTMYDKKNCSRATNFPPKASYHKHQNENLLMKNIAFLLVPLLFSWTAAAQQTDSVVLETQPLAPQQQQPTTSTLQPHSSLALSGAIWSIVNGQSQQCFPIQLDFVSWLEDGAFWGITAQYTSRKDEWVTDSIHYSDDNDQQMVVVLGNYGFRLPVLHNRAFLQLDLGGGVGYHIMKYDAYPNKIVPYIHLGHCMGFNLSKTMALKISILPNITFCPIDVGAAYSHYPSVYGIYTFGLEINLGKTGNK